MHEIRLPQLGQSVEEASIVQWYKAEGDTVEKGEPLYSVQTDKAEIEVEADVSGTLRKILVEPDVFVPVLTVVALAGDANEALPDLSQYATLDTTPPVASTPVAGATTTTESPVTATTAETPGGTHGISPRARKKAADLNVNVAAVQGTGAGGRVMEADVTAAAAAQASIKASPTARRLAALEGVDLQDVQGTGPRGRIMKDDVQRAAAQAEATASAPAGQSKRVPLTPMRRIIAERMVQSKFSAPHYYITVEIDMAEATRFRKAIATVRPSFNDVIMYSTARAIRQFPLVNARWAGDAIEESGAINLGFAVAVPNGLVVPVVRNIENLSIEGVAQQTRELVEKARNGKLTPNDYAGSTFTISNLGAFGVDHFTAIINQPNSAILAIGQIKDRPVVIDGGIHVRPIMKATLSSDHRVIDGAVAAQFMGRLKEIIENAEF